MLMWAAVSGHRFAAWQADCWQLFVSRRGGISHRCAGAVHPPSFVGGRLYNGHLLALLGTFLSRQNLWHGLSRSRRRTQGRMKRRSATAAKWAATVFSYWAGIPAASHAIVNHRCDDRRTLRLLSRNWATRPMSPVLLCMAHSLPPQLNHR